MALISFKRFKKLHKYLKRLRDYRHLFSMSLPEMFGFVLADIVYLLSIAVSRREVLIALAGGLAISQQTSYVASRYKRTNHDSFVIFCQYIHFVWENDM
jgi:hypothetical protein